MRNATQTTAKRNNPAALRLNKAEQRRRLQWRDRWFRMISPESHFGILFEEVPEMHFFAKDDHGRITFLNQSVAARYGITDPSRAIGLTDRDLNPKFLAAGYLRDDERIIATGEPLRGHIELWYDLQGVPNWYEVTKLPIRSRRGKVIGIMGVLRPYRGNRQFTAPWTEIAHVVNYIHEHYARPLTVSALAKLARLSPRQLERRFQEIFAITPKQFLIRTRVSAACRALSESKESLVDIAEKCGFCDQSALTMHFHHCMGMTPSQFRRAQAEKPPAVA